MLELFVVKLIWHQWEFIIWYRLYPFCVNWTWSDLDVQTLRNWWHNLYVLKIVVNDSSEVFLDETLRLVLFCPILSWLTHNFGLIMQIEYVGVNSMNFTGRGGYTKGPCCLNDITSQNCCTFNYTVKGITASNPCQ